MARKCDSDTFVTENLRGNSRAVRTINRRMEEANRGYRNICKGARSKCPINPRPFITINSRVSGIFASASFSLSRPVDRSVGRAGSKCYIGI